MVAYSAMGAGDERTGCGGFCSFIISELIFAGAQPSLAKVLGSKFCSLCNNLVLSCNVFVISLTFVHTIKTIVYQKLTKVPNFQNNFMLT